MKTITRMLEITLVLLKMCVNATQDHEHKKK
jgi:hypothetical protein